MPKIDSVKNVSLNFPFPQPELFKLSSDVKLKKIIKGIIKYFRCCLEEIKFYFVKSYSSYTSVAAEGG